MYTETIILHPGVDRNMETEATSESTQRVHMNSKKLEFHYNCAILVYNNLLITSAQIS